MKVLGYFEVKWDNACKNNLPTKLTSYVVNADNPYFLFIKFFDIKAY